MAIKYDDVIKQFRFKQNDNSKTKFSDYDIKLATNEVIRYISNSLTKQNADFMETSVMFEEGDNDDFKNKGVELPDDFSSLVSVTETEDDGLLKVCLSGRRPESWEYKITGNKLYTGCNPVVLHYKRKLPQITADNREIDLPDVYLDAIVDLMSMVASKQSISDLLGAVDAVVDRMVPRRRYRNAKIAMPFKV